MRQSLSRWSCRLLLITDRLYLERITRSSLVSGCFAYWVLARAGKDLVSSLASGLLTIGERFGGALDGAAQMFSTAYDAGQSPQEFVDSMRKGHKLILGIGHKIKSRTNPGIIFHV
jgi:ATP citrate (pro-S)-lyase